MPNPYEDQVIPLCTHIKTDGVRCGSPALKGTALCFHHSAVKMALGKVTPLEKVSYGSFTPIPFVFPEDRAAMQINYFLLLQALNEQRVEKRAADLMLRMLRSMDKNLGKSGSLVEDCASSDTRSAQESCGDAGGQRTDGASEPASQPVSKTPTSQNQDVGHPHPQVSEEADTYDAINRVIDEVNAAASYSDRGYADYREVSALHPAGQRVLNMYCEPPTGRRIDY